MWQSLPCRICHDDSMSWLPEHDVFANHSSIFPDTYAYIPFFFCIVESTVVISVTVPSSSWKTSHGFFASESHFCVLDLLYPLWAPELTAVVVAWLYQLLPKHKHCFLVLGSESSKDPSEF